MSDSNKLNLRVEKRKERKNAKKPTDSQQMVKMYKQAANKKEKKGVDI